jgi:hypothetical protein
MSYKPPVDLTPLQKDYAVYLPAISSFYSTYVAKQRLEEFVPKDRIPAGFDRGIEGMNFLNPEQGYFYYKYCLYSAGHAQLDLKKAKTQDSMLQSRDRANTLVLGDSGGYQIGKGILKFDWLNFEGPSANKTRDDILDWLENTADWSMMLDVPSWACDHNHAKKTGLKDFNDCLEKTKHNNTYFLTNRQGKTKFLNVLQGSNWDSAEKWYNGVKEFSDPAIWGDKAAEGWAMGGVNMSKMHILLRRLVIMRFSGMLEGKDWMHFLGTAQLDWACYLTSIQRQIRKHINENFTASFDCASPFIGTAHGLVYTNAQHTSKRWGVVMDKATDEKALSGRFDIPFPFQSELGSRLSIADICYYDFGTRKTTEELEKEFGDNVVFDHTNIEHYTSIPRLNKLGKVPFKTSWDSFSYALMMGHNVECHITAVQRANQLADIESSKYKPNWRGWRKLKGADLSDEHSVWVPRNILYFNRFVEELFDCTDEKSSLAMIDDAMRLGFLEDVNGARMRGGVKSIIDQLFTTDDDEDSQPSSDERNDNDLDNLEGTIN